MTLQGTQLPVVLNLVLSYDHQSYRHQFQIRTYAGCHLKAIIQQDVHPAVYREKGNL